MPMEVRGGVPYPLHPTTAVDGSGDHVRELEFPFWCKHMMVRSSAVSCRMYFTQAAFDADVGLPGTPGTENYVDLSIAGPNAISPYTSSSTVEWDAPVEANRIWLRASVAQTGVQLEVVVFQRRG